MKMLQTLPRYLSLSFLYGSIFGIRFTLDIWVFKQVAPHLGANDKYLLVSLTVLGMVFGEILASRISSSVGHRYAILLTSLAYVVWAAIDAVSLSAHSHYPMYFGGFVFGIGFGLFHTALDAWVDEALLQDNSSANRNLVFVQGALLYNFGFLAGASVAFPLLISFAWNANLNAAIEQLSYSPFYLVVLLSSLVLFLSPRGSGAPQKEKTSRSSNLSSAIGEYVQVIKASGNGVWLPISVGGGISLLIQYIDHFAPADLVAGQSLASQSLNIFVLNLTICLCVSALTTYLALRNRRSTFGASHRTALLAVCLVGVIALLLISQFLRQLSGSVLIPLAIGSAQSVLLMLPPLIKAWVIEFGTPGLKATTLSLLGVAKRVPILIISVVLFLSGTTATQGADGSEKIYWVLLLVASTCLVGTLLSRKRGRVEVRHPAIGK